jgi:hypothetical protein
LQLIRAAMTRISIKLFSQLLHKFYSQPKLFFLIRVCGSQELRLLNQFISLGILEEFIFATQLNVFFKKGNYSASKNHSIDVYFGCKKRIIANQLKIEKYDL